MQKQTQPPNQHDAGTKKLSMEALNKKFVDSVFRVLQHDGHYIPHISPSFKAAFSQKTSFDGPHSSHTIITVATDVCVKPPAKKTVLVRLYELIYENDMENAFSLLDEEKVPNEWIWTLIENLSKPCSHQANEHHSE